VALKFFLMVRSASSRVSNHEASSFETPANAHSSG